MLDQEYSIFSLLGAVVLWHSCATCVSCSGMLYNKLGGLQRDYLNPAAVCKIANAMAVPELVASSAMAPLFSLLGCHWTGCAALILAGHNAWRWYSGELFLEEASLS